MAHDEAWGGSEGETGEWNGYPVLSHYLEAWSIQHYLR